MSCRTPPTPEETEPRADHGWQWCSRAAGQAAGGAGALGGGPPCSTGVTDRQASKPTEPRVTKRDSVCKQGGLEVGGGQDGRRPCHVTGAARHRPGPRRRAQGGGSRSGALEKVLGDNHKDKRQRNERSAHTGGGLVLLRKRHNSGTASPVRGENKRGVGGRSSEGKGGSGARTREPGEHRGRRCPDTPASTATQGDTRNRSSVRGHVHTPRLLLEAAVCPSRGHWRLLATLREGKPPRGSGWPPGRAAPEGPAAGAVGEAGALGVGTGPPVRRAAAQSEATMRNSAAHQPNVSADR